MAALPPDVRSALTRIAELVKAYKEDDARQLFAELNERVASDRALAITTHQTLADELVRAGHEEFATFARCRATLAAADDLTRWVELLIESVVTTVGDFHLEAADELVAELASRTSHDRALAFSSRLRLADALVQAWEVTGAIRELKAMLQLELSDDQRLEVATALVRAQRGWVEDDGERARATAQLGSLLAAVSSRAPVELRVRGHLELALTEASLHHASTAAELANTSLDLELRRRANKQYAELLFDAGDLARAEALLSGFTNDEELDARALLEHIGRRRGTLRQPLPEAFADVPGHGPQVLATLPEGFLAYFTPAADELSLIRARGLVSPDTVRMWSHGNIKTASDLESEKIFGPVRSYACRCGRYLGNVYAGVICLKCGVEVIHRGQRALRPGHVVLGRPVVHPWFVPVIARVLNLTQPEVKATSAEELLESLGLVDLVSLAEHLRQEVDYGSATRRAHLTPRLAIVETLIEAEVRPQWCVLEVLPVWPPEAELPPPVDREVLRRRFVEVLESIDLGKAVHRVFGTFVKG